MRPRLFPVLILMLLLAPLSRDVHGQAGVLTQLDGTDGCVSEDGTGAVCVDGKALVAVASVVVSRDGKNVYTASQISDAIAIFARNKKTGVLTQLAGTDGCVSEGGSGGDCTDGKALDFARAVAVSKDGKHVYVASVVSNAIAVFARNKKTGVLTQLAGTDGCVSEDGSGGDCVDGKALGESTGVAVSRDGKHVYVAAQASDAIAVFARNKKTGALAQLAGTDGCVSEDGTGGACIDGKALDGAGGVGGIAVSRDGKHVYVAAQVSDAVAVFARNKKTGALTQLAGTDGCVSEDGSGGDCADGKALDFARGLAVSRDGKNVYVVSEANDAVAVFARNKKTGALTQLAGTDGCVSEDGTGGACVDGKALDRASNVAVSRDGKNVYVISEVSDAVAVFARAKK